jgi:hypothetical protein
MRTAKTNNVETKNVKDESEIVNDSNNSNDDDIDETILGIYLGIKEDEEINLCLRKK